MYGDINSVSYVGHAHLALVDQVQNREPMRACKRFAKVGLHPEKGLELAMQFTSTVILYLHSCLNTAPATNWQVGGRIEKRAHANAWARIHVARGEGGYNRPGWRAEKE